MSVQYPPSLVTSNKVKCLNHRMRQKKVHVQKSSSPKLFFRYVVNQILAREFWEDQTS